MLGLTQGRVWGCGDPRVLGLFAAAVALFVAFAVAEQRRRLPLVHFRFFREGAFTAGVLGTFAATLVLLGAYYFFNLFLQSFVVFDLSPLEAGAALLPLSFGMFAVSLAAGPIAQRVGGRGPIVLGFLAIGLGFLLVSRIGEGSGVTDLIPGFLLIGAGQGMVTGPTSAVAVAAVPEEDAGEASGVVNMGRYLGGSIGVTICGLVYLNTGISKLNENLAGAGSGRGGPAGRRALRRGRHRPRGGEHPRPRHPRELHRRGPRRRGRRLRGDEPRARRRRLRRGRGIAAPPAPATVARARAPPRPHVPPAHSTPRITWCRTRRPRRARVPPSTLIGQSARRSPPWI